MDERETYEDVKRLVARALELREAERRAFVLRETQEDPTVRERALALLAQDQVAGDSLQSPLLLDGMNFAGYRLVRLAGGGGSSLVFEAEQLQPRRRVALKVLIVEEESVRISQWLRFQEEGQVLASLDHPGIARVIESGRATELGSPAFFLAVEWIEKARTLTDYAREARLDLPARVSLITKALEAVAHCHEHGVVHRDLKPGNLLVDDQGRPRLIDFGIALNSAEGNGKLLRTQQGDFLGTLAYASPEQCAGDSSRVGPAADVYALGVLLYELLCDELPYELEGRTITEALQIISATPPTPPSSRAHSIPRELEAVLLKALAKEPRSRYADAAEFLADLRRFQAAKPVLARAPSLAADLRLFWRRQHRASIAVLSITALAALLVTNQLLALSRERELERQAKQQAQASTEFVISLLSLANPRESRPDELTVQSLLEAAGERLEQSPLEDTGAAIELHVTLANSFRELALFEESTRHFELALDLAKDRESLSVIHRAGLLNSFGHALTEGERYDRAVEVLEEAVKIEETSPDAPQWLKAITSSQLARALLEGGDVDRAAEHALFALDTYRAEFGQRHRSVARALNVLAEVALRRGELDLAAKRAAEALELDQENHGPASLLVARSAFACARIARAAGDAKTADSRARQACAIYGDVLSADHPKRVKAQRFLDALEGENDP